MNISIPLLILSLVYNVLILILFITKKKKESKEIKIYFSLLILSLVGIIIDIAGIFSHLNLAETSIVRWFIVKLYMQYLITFVFLMTKYMLFLSKNNKKQENTYLNNVFIISSIVNFILPFTYYNEGNFVYINGLNSIFVYIYSFINICVWIITIINNRKDIEIKKIIPIALFIILGIPVVIIQFLFPQFLLVTSLITLIIIIMYHTIENPDVKMLNELEYAKEHAEKANRAKSEFLSSMSHEIRTPLNAIVGFSEIIKTEIEPEKIIEDADNIIMASENLLEIVNGILDISKIEANKMEIVNTNYQIMPNLENLSKLIQPRIGEKPIELKTSFAPDLPHEMFGDIGKIKQIITNILTNAVKYTEEGEIDFSVNCINEKDNCSLVISIKDTGRGIREEKIGALFQKFQRLDEDRNTTLEGTGLGLAITKSLTELMGGKIVVTSKYGKGSQFTIYINQKIVKLHAGSQDKKINAESINTEYPGSRVLIVDDNNLNLKVASKILSSFKIETMTANSGPESIELIEKGESFDLILMDDMMPRMNGTEALQRLKKLPNFNIPVISLTANAITGVEEKYIKAGFNDYLSKPINKIELVEKLNKYLIKEENYSNIRVLIVDDNKLNIKVCMNFLKSYNFTIESVLSGFECIEKIKAGEKYDLIFMDDMMPEMSGPETLNELKKLINFKAIVISHTANAIEGAREKYLKDGFDEYIAKPLSKEELKKIIDKLLD